mgnify:CR=1 FL=1
MSSDDKLVLLCTKNSQGNFHGDSVEMNDRGLQMLYSGQTMGRNDHVLADAVNRQLEFIVYYRNKDNIPFSLIGKTKHVRIARHRQCEKNTYASEDERLLLELTFTDFNDPSDPSAPPATVMEVFQYDGRYKFDVLYSLNAIDRLGNQVIPFNKNNSLGFYLLRFGSKNEVYKQKSNGLVYNYCHCCRYFRHGYSDEFLTHYCYHCWGEDSWGGCE